MLMDAALERISAARIWGDPVDSHRVEPAVLIIVELRAGLDLHQGGPIAASVDDLYDYMCRRLKSAGLPNGIAALDEVSHLLRALRSAWAFLQPSGQRRPTQAWAAAGN
jgi:flagellar protein FliS